MLRNLPLVVLFFVIPFIVKAQEPCDVVFDLFGQDTACVGGASFYLPPVAPFGGTYSGLNVSANGLFDLSGLSAGEYEVIYTADSAVCIGSASAIITLVEPTRFTLVGTTEVCVGGTTVLTSEEGYELTWDDGTKSILREFTPDSTYETYAAFTDAAGCTYYNEFTLVVSDFDSTAVVAPQQVCYGQEITIDIVNATSVQWLIDFSESTRITTSFTQDTTLELKIYSGLCDSIFNFTIEVADSIEFEIITDTTLCTGQTALAVGVGNPLSYRIDGYGEFTDSLAFEIADDVTVYVQVFGEFDCTADYFISYIVDEFPPLALTYPDSICETYPIELFASGAYEYLWIDLATGDTLQSGTQQDLQLTAEQSLNWSIVGSSFYGCQTIQDLDVYVEPTPVVGIDTLSAFCLERPILLQGNGAYQYTWSNGSVGDTLEFLGLTDTLISVTGATALGCVNYDTLNITIHEVPIVTAFGENSICEGDTATVTAIGATRYVWEGLLEGETVNLTPIVDSAVSFVGYNVYGCSDFSVFNINVDPAPIIQFLGSNFICEGDSSSLEVVTDGVFSWSDGSLDAVIPVTPEVDTTYVVNAIGGNGCPRTSSFTVAVYPYPQLTFNGPTVLCYGDSAQVLLTGAAAFSWSNGLQGDSVAFVPQASQTILIYGSSMEGCTTIYPYALTIYPTPQVQFAFSADTLCESGSGISWTASPSGGLLEGDGVVDNWFNLGSALNGVNTVSYTVANEFNCEASASDELIVETCLSAEDLSAPGLELFPNPASDEVMLKWTGAAAYTIMNQQGQVMEKGQFSSLTRIDISSWVSGLYMIEVHGTQTSETVRLVKY